MFQHLSMQVFRTKMRQILDTKSQNQLQVLLIKEGHKRFKIYRVQKITFKFLTIQE